MEQIAKIRGELNERQRKLNEKERALLIKENEILRHNQLFELKWKLLEDELNNLANDREELTKEKLSYQRKKKNYEKDERTYNHRDEISMFFLGVSDELSLKKRYRDLLKLFHPDSLNGDIYAMQVINNEYDKIKKRLDIL